MTIKIKLTQEQANYIEKSLANGIDKEEMLNRFAEANCFEKQPRHSLHGLCVMDLARALLIGYEIEPEPLQVGDWAKITHELTGTYIGEILEIKTDHNGIEVARAFWNYQHSASLLPLKFAVKCTPEEIESMKERRLWSHQARREVKGFREGDIVIYRQGVPFLVSEASEMHEGFITIETAKKWYEVGDIKGFHRLESFISFEEVEPNESH